MIDTLALKIFQEVIHKLFVHERKRNNLCYQNYLLIIYDNLW